MKKLMFVLSVLCLLVLAACGESAHEHSLSDWQSDATNHWKSCSGCSELLEEAGHTFGEWNVVLEATEASVGSKERVCSVCSYKEVAEIEKLAHTEEVIPAVGATCTETGLTEGKKCSVCGTVIVGQSTVPATGHSYESVVTDPTCTADGYTTHTCACGDVKVDSEIAAIGHAYEATVTKEATCTETGVRTYTCKNDATHTYTEPIPMIDHEYGEEYYATVEGKLSLVKSCHCGELVVLETVEEAVEVSVSTGSDLEAVLSAGHDVKLEEI